MSGSRSRTCRNNTVGTGIWYNTADIGILVQHRRYKGACLHLYKGNFCRSSRLSTSSARSFVALSFTLRSVPPRHAQHVPWHVRLRELPIFPRIIAFLPAIRAQAPHLPVLQNRAKVVAVRCAVVEPSLRHARCDGVASEVLRAGVTVLLVSLSWAIQRTPSR